MGNKSHLREDPVVLQNKTALVALLGKTAFLSVCESCHRNAAETETKCNYGNKRQEDGGLKHMT